MNVVDKKKSLITNRGRGRRLNTETDHGPQIPPKYQLDRALQLVPNRYSAAYVDTSAMKTPNRQFQGASTSSSSARRTGHRKRSTPRNSGVTGSSSTSKTGTELPIVIAITEGRGDARGEVGIAAVNVENPHLILSQISDRHNYMNTLTKILIFRPVEIIMPETMIGNSGTGGKLYECIRDKFPGLNIAAVSRQHFSNANGLDRIKSLAAQEYSSVEIYVRQKFYALAAAGALLKYVEYTRNILYIPKTMKIEFQSSEATAIIDIESVKNLELVSHQDNSNKFTLLGVLDRCLTPGGKRYLRSSILQPSCNERLIAERQSCVAEMVEDSTLLTSIQSLIRKLCDVDRLLVLGLNTPQKDNISSAEKNLNYVISLKTTLEAIPFLQTALRTSKANFFRKVLENLEDPRFGLMMNTILEVLQPDACHSAGFNSSTMQRCFALKAGLNDMLDIARQAYCELIDDMKGLVETLALKYNLPFTLGCSASLGYHIQMESSRRRPFKITDLPPVFIEVQKQKSSYVMTTEALLVLSQRCKDACEELHLMSNVHLKGMLNSIREHIGCLYQLSNDISELDVMVSLASVSSLSNYTRPVFGPRTELKNSMHPLMDITGTCVPVANDVYASLTHNFNVITGPNMGGKSVYLRQVVMLQIMAQIGCFVPAEKAQFRIADRIFCRICFGDSFECNASSFVLEIKESQYILQMITPRSLVIMDELCRGTTTEEGESIAFAICEQLLDTPAFVFFTTHFLFLTKLAEMYPNVRNYHFESMCRPVEGLTEPRLIYTHKLVPGVMTTRNYGLALAETCGVPSSITKMARAFAAKLNDKTTPVNTVYQVAERESHRFYKEVASMYKMIEDGEFCKEKVFEVIKRLRGESDNSTSNEEDALTSEQVPGSSRSSMLSITERFNRLRNKRILDSRASDSDFTAFHNSSASAARLSNIPAHFDSPSPSPSKKFMSRTPSSRSRLIDVPILPPSGPVRESSPALPKFSPLPGPSFIRQSNSGSGSQSAKLFSISVKEVEESGERLCECGTGASPTISNSSSSPSVIELLSQLSTDTIKAKITAREKEARIFREIEGDDFQESEFYGSVFSRNPSSLSNVKHE